MAKTKDKKEKKGLSDPIGSFKEASQSILKTMENDPALLKEDVMQDYLNREDFSYDPNGDALYRYYRDRYMDQGKTAMEDTMGQAAALTGGYGSSYAQNVGQQAYNSHLKELGDVIPELYQLAYDRYQDKGDELLQRYQLLDQQDQQEYDRYRDQVADDQWQQTHQEKQRQFDRNYDLDQQRFTEDQRQFDQNHALNQQKFTEDQRQFDQNHALNQQKFTEDQRQFDQNHALNQQKFTEDQRQFDQNHALNQQKFTEDQRQFDQTHALEVSKHEQEHGPSNYYTWLNTSQGKGERQDSTGSYKISYDNGKVKTGDILAMQRALGVEETGMWSATSRAACGGLSADEAFALYQKGLLSQKRATN